MDVVVFPPPTATGYLLTEAEAAILFAAVEVELGALGGTTAFVVLEPGAG